MMAVQRIVVLRCARIVLDVDVDHTTSLSFLLACHDNFRDAHLYLEGELVDSDELEAVVKECSASVAAPPINRPAPGQAGLAAPAPTPLAPPVMSMPPVTSLSEFKEASEFVGNSFEKFVNFQISAFARCSDTIHKHLDQLMGHGHKLAEEGVQQRKQHREALHEIDVFDRGTKVAVMAEEAELRSGQARRRSEVDGYTGGDFIEGFSRLAADPRNA